MSQTMYAKRLRCLSVHQPWARLICSGSWQFENRTWKTDFRGTIAIHASSSQSMVKTFLSELKVNPYSFKLQDFAFGAIIGLADVVDIQVYGRAHEAEAQAIGPYCWRMSNPRLLRKPIPMPGNRNLFELDPTWSRQVLEAESYVLDLSSKSSEAALAQMLTEEPSPVDRYNYAIAELEEKLPASELTKMATRMIELAPSNPLGYMHRISLQDSSASEELARADFEKLVSIVDGFKGSEVEDYELALSFCAAQLSDENRDDLAVKFWRQLIQLDDENAWYRRGLGKTLLSNPATHVEAVIELERAIALTDDGDYDDLDIAYMLSTLAEGYRITQSLERAKETVERAMKLDRELSEACYVAARIAVDANDRISAKALLRKTLILEPDFEEAADLMKQLS